MADGEYIGGDSKSRGFFYASVDSSGQAFQGTIILPTTGFIEKLKDKLEENTDNNVDYNFANILTQNVIDFCIACIESEHTTRSKKAVGYLTLVELLLSDVRFANDNVPRAIAFLERYAAKISKGITLPATESDFYRQSDVAGFLMQNLVKVCELVADADKRRSQVDSLVATYSSALAEFFVVPSDVNKDEYSDTRDYSSHLFMKVLTDCNISVPEFFKQARLAFMKVLAEEAFDYASRPDSYLHNKALGISQKFSGIAADKPNGIGTLITDPIHFIRDQKGNFLILAESNPPQQVKLIFNIHLKDGGNFGATADSHVELEGKVEPLRTCDMPQPAEALRGLLNEAIHQSKCFPS